MYVILKGSTVAPFWAVCHNPEEQNRSEPKQELHSSLWVAVRVQVLNYKVSTQNHNYSY